MNYFNSISSGRPLYIHELKHTYNNDKMESYYYKWIPYKDGYSFSDMIIGTPIINFDYLHLPNQSMLIPVWNHLYQNMPDNILDKLRKLSIKVKKPKEITTAMGFTAFHPKIKITYPFGAPIDHIFSYSFFDNIEALVDSCVTPGGSSAASDTLKILISNVYAHELGHFTGMRHYDTWHVSVMDINTDYHSIPTIYEKRDYRTFRLH